MYYLAGYGRFSEDVEMMTGTKLNWYFRGTLFIITPLVLTVVLNFVLFSYDYYSTIKTLRELNDLHEWMLGTVGGEHSTVQTS